MMEKPPEKMNRREFLRKAGKAGLGALFVSALSGLVKGEEATPETEQEIKHKSEIKEELLSENKIEPNPKEGEFLEKAEKWHKEYTKGGKRYRSLQNGWGRLERDLIKVTGILKEYGVPLEVMSLALVESDWISNARSPIGAFGYWQFMPETWPEFGKGSLEKHGSNVVESTKAACEYLKYLYKFAKKSADKIGISLSNNDLWIWAFFAYNHGPGNMFGNKEKIGYFFDCEGDLNKYYEFCEHEEAREYAPKIIGLNRALKNLLMEEKGLVAKVEKK